MKKIICFVLSLIMVIGVLASCTSLVDGDKGSIITMYFGDQIYDYDPISGFNDTTKSQILSLVFEGLTTLDANGNWKKGMMKSYEYKAPTKDGEDYTLLITLGDSKWSDGRTVQANDFVYAWKRIIEPTTACEAASLLYDIKNARDIKMGEESVDDLGVVAVETYKLEITFTHNINLDDFFKNCASVALVPLREDKAGGDVEWAKRASTMVTNGPFDIRKITYGQELVLERSSYYRRDTDSNQALDKYVTPYRLIVYYNYGGDDAQLEKFENNDIFYLAQIALSAREDYKNVAKVSDAAVTTTLYFNNENKNLKSADVRKALSMAIDREALAEKLVFAKAATGFIPYGVDDANSKGDFRDTADKEGAIIDVSANVDEAKSLLKSSGASSMKLNLIVRNTEIDVEIANFVADAWKSIGVTVNIKKVSAEAIAAVQQNQSIIYTDVFANELATSDFDVALIHYNMLSPDAFSALSTFSPEFSGNGVDMTDIYSTEYPVNKHITKYSNESYDELIESAYVETDSSKKTEILHNAEKQLLDDMPICPLVFEQNAYCVSNVISGVSATYWGVTFQKTKMKNYMEYKESIQEANREEEVAED